MPIHDKLTLKLKAVVRRSKLEMRLITKNSVVSTVDINNARLELDIAKARLGEIKTSSNLRKAKENI